MAIIIGPRIIAATGILGFLILAAQGAANASSNIHSAPADALDNRGRPATKSPTADLSDGFEGNTIASFWLPGNYGSGLYVPGAIHLSTNYARSGSHCVQITVHEGDVDAPGDAGTRVERSELDSGHFPLLGREIWYGFSVFIPKDFPLVDNRLVNRCALPVATVGPNPISRAR